MDESILQKMEDSSLDLVKSVSKTDNELTLLLISATLAIIVIFISFFIAKFILKKKSIFTHLSSNNLITDIIQQSLAIFIRVVGIVVALQIVGAGSLVGAILGAAGVIGLGISFAFKDIVENYIAGIILSVRQPFLKDDYVKMGDAEGIIQRMTTRITMLKTLDGNNISIPNAYVFKSNIINYTKNPHRRFEFDIGINPEADPNHARKIGLFSMKSLEGILDDPTPFALIHAIGDSSIILKFFGWVNQSEYDYFQVRSDAIGEVKSAIENEGIEIPDPSYIIKLRETKQVQNITHKKPELRKSLESREAKHLHSPKINQTEIAKQQMKSEKHDPGLLTGINTE